MSTTKNIKFIILTVFSCFFITSAIAQEEKTKEKSEFWKKVRFGGGIGLNSGSRNFSATLSPSAIYQFNDKFSLGFGLNGTYNKIKDASKSTVLGGSLISLFNPLKGIQLSAELEQLNVNRKFEGTLSGIPDSNFWTPALFLGAGYTTNHVTFGVRYDVLYNDTKSIYGNAFAPFIRVLF